MLALKLLYAAIIEQDFKVLSQVTKAYAKDDYDKFAFVKFYYAKHGCFPDIALVEDKFSIQLPQNTGKANYWFGELKDKYRTTVVDNVIRSMAKNRADSVDIMRKALITISMQEDRSVVAYNADTKERKLRYLEKKKAQGVTYLSTGDSLLDSFTYGYRPGDFWLLAGYEKSGKSFKLLQWANNTDKIISQFFSDRGILFVSCEVEKSEFEGRLDCINAEIPYDKFELGSLSLQQEAKYYRWLKKAEDLYKSGRSRLVIVDDLGSIDDVFSYIEVYNPAVVFIDSVHLLAKSLEYKDLLAITGKIKSVARLSKVPIIATTHTNLKEGDGLDKINSRAFANFRAGRDPDFTFVMFSDKDMVARGEMGVYTNNVRRAKKFVEIYRQNWHNMQEERVLLQSYDDYISITDDDDGSIY